MSRPKVMVVDDEPLIRKLLEVTMSFGGFEVVTVGDGQEALDTIADVRPDLIVLDVLMPRVGGFQVLEALKMDERFEHIPIVMLTGKAEEGSIKRGLRGGVSGYLTKPFDPVRLNQLARQALERAVVERDTLSPDDDEG